VTTPPFTGVDDEEGGNGKTLPPWYIPGWTVQNRLTANVLAPEQSFVTTAMPSDQAFLLLTQAYIDGDSNPRSGYLTFYPSDSFTIREGTNVIRITQSFLGTQTWPQSNVSTSPWAFSTEASGKIYLFGGVCTVKLPATDNPHITTDSGLPLTYHVIEHFLGGQEFDITVPAATNVSTTFIRDLMVSGSAKKYQYDPVFPFGQQSITAAPEPVVVNTSIQFMPYGSTDFVAVDVSALLEGTSIPADITNDDVFFAFTLNDVDPVDADFHPGVWAAGGPPFVAEILIGPENGGLVLPVGKYTIWFKLVDFPTVPIINVGSLIIT
jgi:hypothetical protein